MFFPKLIILFPALCRKLLWPSEWRQRRSRTELLELVQTLSRQSSTLVHAVDADSMRRACYVEAPVPGWIINMEKLRC